MRAPYTYLIYVDESYDLSHFVYAAGLLAVNEWNHCFLKVQNWRRDLFHQYGIPLEFELHATDLVGGRGEPLRNRDKDHRAKLFQDSFIAFETIRDIQFMTAVTRGKKNRHDLFRKLILSIQNYLEIRGDFGILICDEGDEGKLTSLVRALKKQGVGLSQIIEDPLFKSSKSSYFVQIVDLVAFGVLRQEAPLWGVTHPLVQSSFSLLNRSLLSGLGETKKGIIEL